MMSIVQCTVARIVYNAKQEMTTKVEDVIFLSVRNLAYPMICVEVKLKEVLIYMLCEYF